MVQRKSRTAKQTRSIPTAVEALLWKYLRGRHAGGVKFRRQHPVEGFVADFYCPQAKLVVELDGSIHREREHYDAVRTERLQAAGLRVLRFRNDEVIKDAAAVASRITAACQERVAERSPG